MITRPSLRRGRALTSTAIRHGGEHLGPQRGPIGDGRRRKSTDDDIDTIDAGTRRLVAERLEARGLQPTTYEVAAHGASDLLRDDEAEACVGARLPWAQVAHGVGTGDLRTPAHDDPVVVGARDAVGFGEHRRD